ncbi:hypothetical protein GGX14DRAFT_692155 [Mycena pura]|uniref:ABC transporter domain-containing protein n=1 Tax=Mycena pura TaxID=153505 RepID=A0AAD6YV90_9AGAR|nr:hypothetical protein GGX14DRAFT_692155 [Mycena pura]
MTCVQDKSFGPASTCRDLDFTLYFEQTILSFSPDVVFIVFAFLRLVYLNSKSRRTKASGWSYALLALKDVAALFVLSATIASLVVSRHQQIYSTSLGLAAPAVQIISAVFLTALVPVEHFKSLTPSTLIITYAFIKGLFGAATMRTSLKLVEPQTTIVLLELVTAAYLLLVFAEILGKGRAVLDKQVAEVSATSFVSRPLFLWLIPLMWSGRKKKLVIPDCGAIPAAMGAHASTEPLRKVLGIITSFARPYGAFPLLFLSPVFPRILLMLAAFTQPLLILRMIDFNRGPDAAVRAWLGACRRIRLHVCAHLPHDVRVLGKGDLAVFNSTIRYRGALVGNIYSKTLRLSSASGREVGGGVASTYMSVDVERVCLGLETLHEMRAAIVSIILAVALLWSQTTWPTFLPLAVTLILVTVSGSISRGVGAVQKQWLGSTDKRVKFLTSIFMNFLPMKLSHYEVVVAARAAHLREQEMHGAWSFYNNITITGALTSSSWAICTLAVLGPYAALAAHGHGHGSLNPSRFGLPQLLAASASLKRIQKYLMMDEHARSPAEAAAKPAEAGGDITLENASFSWAADKPAFLGPLSVALRPELHVCVGPVASGKTLFLLSLLGESVLTEGKLTPPAAGARVAYAAQDPLIVPGTLRENILFGQEYSEKWYNTVVEACALVPDLARLTGGDGTREGRESERGPAAARVPRACDLRARAVDGTVRFAAVLFSLFYYTDADAVFQALFGPTGLLQNKAVILVTNNVRHLNRAANVLVFDAGALIHQGTLDDVAAAGYRFTRSDTAQVESAAAASVEANGKPDTAAKPHVAQKEVPEKPIAQSSLGWTPYAFYMTMAGWSGSILVIALLAGTGLARLALQIYQQQWSNSGGKHTGAWVGGYAGLVVAYLLFIGFGMWVYTLVISK